MCRDQHLLACVHEFVDDKFDDFGVDSVFDLVKQHEAILRLKLCQDRHQAKHPSLTCRACVVMAGKKPDSVPS